MQSITPYPDLLEELPDWERNTFCANVDLLTLEISSKINSVESV
jgi:hypothetical protein